MSAKTTIAESLLAIEAVSLKPNDPFRYTSGILSPIYCDNRLIISYPDVRSTVIDAFLQLIAQHHLQFDVIAGVATSGIPHAAWLADRLNKPMLYVRGASKKHGKQNQIEGKVTPGQTALVIEDLISTGGSALAAAQALQQAGLKVNHCLAVFSYQLPTAVNHFKTENIACLSLTDFNTLLNVAEKNNTISAEEKAIACTWNEDPKNWGKKMGFET